MAHLPRWIARTFARKHSSEHFAMFLTAEQYIRLELVKIAVAQKIPPDRIPNFVDLMAAAVLATPKNGAA